MKFEIMPISDNLERNEIEITDADAEKEVTFEQFSEWCNKGCDKASRFISERFEICDNPDNRLMYHRKEHSEEVGNRSILILEKIAKVFPSNQLQKLIPLAKLVAAFHDTVQDYKEIDGVRKRNLFAEGDPVILNEEKSADELEEFMRFANEQEGTEVFSEEMITMAREAILGTVPGFNPDKGTVIQEKVNAESNILTHVIALSDIGTAGMGGAEKYVEDGKTLFWEEHMLIRRKCESWYAGKTELDDMDKKFIESKMRAWINFQPIFANGRKDLFNEELEKFQVSLRGEIGGDGLNDAIESVRALFGKFDESIEAAKKRARDAQGMSFEELVGAMGFYEYVVPKQAASV